MNTILNRVQGAAVIWPLNGVPEHLTHTSRVWSHHWRYISRQKADRKVEPLQHTCTREVDIDRVLEDHVYHGETKCRRRPHGADMRQPLQVRGQRISNLIFYFLRTATRPVSEHNHLVFHSGQEWHRWAYAAAPNIPMLPARHRWQRSAIDFS